MLFRRDPFNELWGELSRVQDELFRAATRPTVRCLPLNLWADDHAVYAQLDLPDADPKNLEVTVQHGTELTIKGERKPIATKDAVWVRQERPTGTFTRSVTLPVLVDADKVEAKYELGVLHLTLPRSEAGKPRKIAVKA